MQHLQALKVKVEGTKQGLHHTQLPETGKGKKMDSPRASRRKHNPADTLILDQ